MTITKPLSKPLPARVADIRKRAPFLPEPTVALWDESPRLYLDGKQQPWVLVVAERDPMRTLKGEVAIPQRCLAELQRISATGVDFDRLTVAHEISPDVVPLSIRKELDSNGVRCTQEVAEFLVGTITPPPKAGRQLAKALDNTVTALTRGLAAAPMVMSDLALDPIIFGVLGESGPPTSGAPSFWFPLTAWTW